MATATVDIVQELSAEEDRGAIIRLTRRCIVTGLTETDPQILTTALATSGIPAEGSTPTGFDNLVCVKRTARLADGQKTIVWVDCQYVSKSEARRDFIAEGSISLIQIETQKDRRGRQITVEHTFPEDDPDFPSETITQGGSVSVLTSRPMLSFTGLMQHDNPVSLVQNWASRLNSKTWYNGWPWFWMCTNVDYTLHDSSVTPWEYEFTFQFAYNNNRWIPKVVFIDAREGKPPPDLVNGVGYKDVDWYLTRDFNELFPSS